MTIGECLRRAEETLQPVSDAPRIDAERILLHVLKRDEAAWLYAHAEKELSQAQTEELHRCVAERVTGKPLAYVLGEWEFYGRPFTVNEDVLVPRPETEALVTAALHYIRTLMRNQDQVMVADIGTGSGCIAVTLVLESAATVLASDVSPAALRVSTKNAQRYGVQDRITFLQGDMLQPLRGRNVDLIVSNPPYVPSAELDSPSAHNARQTLGLTFEPRMALDGGTDGQRYIRQIAASGIPAFIEGTGGDVLRFNVA